MGNLVHYTCVRGNCTQILINGDLEDAKTIALFYSIVPDKVRLVYSDPPWNPGNATYWRTHAGVGPCASYDSFLDRWTSVVSKCILQGATDVFTEQSINDKHRDMFISAVQRQESWKLPLVEQWTVFYGSPGSASVRRPNSLLHFGSSLLRTDPQNMAGEPMTLRVCAGISAPPGSWIVDPCIGKGMTSRMAVYFSWNCIGIEINAKRLSVTIEWLKRQGYEVKSHG
jgi:hypothetical protein